MKSLRSSFLASAALGVLCLGAGPIVPSLVAQTTQSAPDNSANNKQQSPTADNQTNAKSDRMTTAHVRRAIMADKGLSMYAHNCKILVADGNVTLKGPVKSEDEKSKVAADAATVVSPDHVSNQLTVK